MAKMNPKDSTLRNTQAGNKKIEKLKDRIKKLEIRTQSLNANQKFLVGAVQWCKERIQKLEAARGKK